MGFGPLDLRYSPAEITSLVQHDKQVDEKRDKAEDDSIAGISVVENAGENHF